jgi:hypothetical protein
MDLLARHSTLDRITNVAIERRHKCLTVSSEEEGRCSYGIGVVQGGIIHGRAYPPAGGAHGDNQYP